MRKQEIIKQLAKQLEEANGRRKAHIIPADDAEYLYGRWMEERRLLRSYKQNPDTLDMLYDPHCVPNCYKFRGSTTAVIIRRGCVNAYVGHLEKRPHGRKWSFRFTFSPDGTHAVPPGYTQTGFKRV